MKLKTVYVYFSQLGKTVKYIGANSCVTVAFYVSKHDQCNSIKLADRLTENVIPNFYS